MAAPVEKENVVVAIVNDLETGGTDCTRCAVTQVSLHAVRLDTFELMETYSAYVYPYCKKEGINKPKKKALKNKYDEGEEDLMDYEEKALEVSGITMDMLYSMGKPIEEVAGEVCEFIKRNTLPVTINNRPIMVGHNPQFDKGFFQQMMVYTDMWPQFCKVVRGNKDFWGNFQPALVDTIIMCQLALDDDKSINTWKLESMANRLGIDLDDAHNSDADTMASREILKVLVAWMRAKGQGSDSSFGGFAMEKKEKLRDHFRL